MAESNDVDNVLRKNDKDFKVKGLSFDVTKIISFALPIALILVVTVFSLIPVGFDWQKAFTDGKWWANFAVLSGLVIFGMIYGDAEGRAFLKNYVYGAFQCAREAFLNSVDKIMKLNARALYADWLQGYNSRKRQRVYEELMYRYKINKEYFDVLDLPQDKFDEIKTLIDNGKLNIVEYEGKYYKLSLKQWELCNSIRNGEIHVSTIDNDCYFLTENHNALADDDKLVMNANSQKIKNKTLIFVLRLFMLLAISALMAGFFVDKEQTLTQQAWFDLCSRLLTLLSGVSTGISTAHRNIKIDVFVYKHKLDRNNEFIEDIEQKRFIPVNEQAKAKAEFEAQKVEETKNLVENTENQEI